jgi:hypothetical protein
MTMRDVQFLSARRFVVLATAMLGPAAAGAEFTTDPSFYRSAADCEVIYDSGIASRYDDGYSTDAYLAFEKVLQPYGRWIDEEKLGHIWVPSRAIVGNDFAPYASAGRWSLTEYGWTWISDWDWGRVVFHYGRWVFLSDAGWSWVPGKLWGPAWVAWRRGRNHVAWAPLPPRGIDVPRLFSDGFPWHFANVKSVDFRVLKLTPHQAFTIFGHLVARTQDRVLLMNGVSILTNAGPVGARLANGAVRIPLDLDAVSPQSRPSGSIMARIGLPVEKRPWWHQAWEKVPLTERESARRKYP